MTMLPILLEELSRPTIYDQHFGLGLLDDDLFLGPCHRSYNRCPVLLKSYLKPHRLNSAANSGLSCIQDDSKNFKVDLDVQQFKPEEVSVKVVNGYIVIDGKHDEHGLVSHQFTRRYKLPDNVDADAITSTLSSDGVLSIGAPRKVPENTSGERPIQIIQTNEPSIKQLAKEKENGEKMRTI